MNVNNLIHLLQRSSATLLLSVVVMACGCGDDSLAPATSDESVAVSPETAADPMSIIPDDIQLWEAFDAKRILKQPDTNTLVVEGSLDGDIEALVVELETASVEKGWSTDTLTTHSGLSTLIMSKDSRRLKVNLTQEDGSVGVYLTTRLPE